MPRPHIASPTTTVVGAVAMAALLLTVVVSLRMQPLAGPSAPSCAGCNVVLISMDTLRADHVGAYGYDRPTTPNLDRLAERAVLFEDAISQSAWTRPAHFSMMTGLHPAEHGVISMAGHARIPHDVPTLAETLAAHGYATGAFTGGANLSEHFGFDRGFDVYQTHGKRMLDNLPAATAWVEAHAAGSFFLFFHGLDPHRPYVSEQEDRAALGLSDEPAAGWKQACKSGERPASLRPYLDNYDAAIRRGDRALGGLLGRLADLGVMDRTMIVFTSDHGEEFFEHGRCFHIYTLYGEILRVPLLVYVPGVEPRRVRGVVPASVAVAPTVLDLLGIVEHPLAGPSLGGVVRGGEREVAHAVSETSSRWRPGRPSGHVRALTTDDEKLIHWIDEGRYAYFDLRADPLEQRPISRGPRVDVLRDRLAAWVESHPPLARGARGDERLPARLEKELRALGYFD